MGTIEGLIDRDAVTSGAAGDGKPWQHHDLGHGYGGYSFLEQCPHRMLAHVAISTPQKGSTKAQLLEAKTNLQRMLTSIPLTDDERAAVDDGKPPSTPPSTDSPTPRHQTGLPQPSSAFPQAATLLPIIEADNANLIKINST